MHASQRDRPLPARRRAVKEHALGRNRSTVFEQKARFVGLSLLWKLIQQLAQQARALRTVLQLTVTQGKHEPLLGQFIARRTQFAFLQ